MSGSEFVAMVLAVAVGLLLAVGVLRIGAEIWDEIYVPVSSPNVPDLSNVDVPQVPTP